MYVTNPSRSISLHAKYFFAIPTTLKAKLFPVIKGQEIYHFPTGVSSDIVNNLIKTIGLLWTLTIPNDGHRSPAISHVLIV